MSAFVTLLVATIVIGCEHVYLWLRFGRELGVSPLVMAALALFVPLAIGASRIVAPRISRWWMTPALTWLGVSLITSLVLLVLEPIRWFVDVPSSVVLISSLALSAWAAIDGRRVHVRRIEVPITKLPLELDGFSFVQLSDVHLGPTSGRAFMQRVVDAANELAPDAMVVTGDLIDAPVSQLRDEVAPLAKLRSQFGTFFVTGNHEYHAGPRDWCAQLEQLGVRVLRNERVELTRAGKVIQLVGTDDSDPAGRADGFIEDLPTALRDRTDAPLVLLAHQPKSVHEAARNGVDLQLSGHTHGGQFWPLGWLLRVGQPAVSGLHHFGKTALYVSNGTGHSGPPMRLATPAEITHVVLRISPIS